MKNYFAKNFFRNLRMCELLANGIIKDFLYHVYALQYLINMEEQAKLFWLAIFLRWLSINSTQWRKIIRRSCTRFAFELEPIITKNCDVFTHSYDFCIVTTRNYDFFLVLMHNCVAVFRNCGSRCDRSYAVTASQFDRNETHGMLHWDVYIWLYSWVRISK